MFERGREERSIRAIPAHKADSPPTDRRGGSGTGGVPPRSAHAVWRRPALPHHRRSILLSQRQQDVRAAYFFPKGFGPRFARRSTIVGTFARIDVHAEFGSACTFWGMIIPST